MNKKIFGILIIGLFIGAGFVPVISGEIKEKHDTEIIDYVDFVSLLPDELDQYMDDPGCCAIGPNPGEYDAQSFKPSLNKLTRVELMVSLQFDVNSALITVSIRNNLDGSDLTSTTITIYSRIWNDFVEFDFPDIDVIPSETYYIVITGFDFLMRHVSSYNDYYTNGEWWRYLPDDGYWKKYSVDPPPYGDLTFRTYGYGGNEEEPNIVINKINGGFGLGATLVNNGTNSAEDVSWSIDVEADFAFILSGSHTEGMIDDLGVNDPYLIQSDGLRGIGFITITVEVADAVKQATAFLLGPLVLRVNEL